MPRLTEVTAIESYPCKGWQETKEWLARKEEIDNICVHGMTFSDYMNGKYQSCVEDLEKEFTKTKPKSIEVNTVCDKEVKEVWFRVFGRNWFKIK